MAKLLSTWSKDKGLGEFFGQRMSETAILLASGPCLIAALGAISMFLIGSNRGARTFAYVWGIGFAASALQWLLLTLNLKFSSVAHQSMAADILGIVWAVALAEGFRLRNGSRKDDQAFLAAVVVACLIMIVVGSNANGPVMRPVIVPVIKMVFMVWAMPKVTASRYRFTTSEFATIVMLAMAAIAYLLSAILGPGHADLLTFDRVDPIIMRSTVAGPATAAFVLFSLLLVASDFSTTRRRFALTDPLTRLLNRAGFESAMASAMRGNRTRCVVFVDIDHFKTINDERGHAIGDAVLVGFAIRLVAALRDDERACRIGGEEFALILACSADSAFRKVEALRESVAQLEIGAAPDLRFTASFGIVRVGRGETLSSVVRRADRALYLAKDGGRNRTTPVEQTAP